MKATRQAYGETLRELGGQNTDIVVLDADLSCSTNTATFAKEYPNRFFNTGIAESNMIGVAAGLATAGKIPFASTFAVFGVTHAGLTVGEDGATHQMLEDLSLMRALPNMSVVVPADALETAQVIRWAADYKGPVYIRLGRAKVEDIPELDKEFKPGISTTLCEGKDITLIACGIMTIKAIKAAEILKEEGIFARVINMSYIKPIDSKAIAKAAKETGAIVTCEEHTIMGGLGSAVAEIVVRSHPVPMAMVGTQDVFGQSGKADELLDVYGLTAEHIAEEARKLMEDK